MLEFLPLDFSISGMSSILHPCPRANIWAILTFAWDCSIWCVCTDRNNKFGLPAFGSATHG
jgi:hypothetical protein